MLITDVRILTPAETLDGALRILDGRIREFLTTEQITCGPDELLIEGRGGFLVPGFIDLQVNGGFGHDFTDDPEAIPNVAAQLTRFGVTSFLPTLITSPRETIERALRVVERRQASGAEILGLHLEGPFLNPSKKGAHPPEHLRPPDPDSCSDWTPEKGVRLVTLAPELDGALEVARELAERGVVVSAGHSLASFEQAAKGFRAGIRYGTHLWNAMSGLDHRQPGLAGALLEEREITVGLIADGVHIHPTMVDLAWRLKGPDRLNLVSDAMAGLGMAPGRYKLGDAWVVVDDSTARLEDGTLAGSVLPLDVALRHLMMFTGCGLSEALATITSTPAHLLGLEDRGVIAPGKRADLVLLDGTGNVAMTWIAGEIAFRAKP